MIFRKRIYRNRCSWILKTWSLKFEFDIVNAIFLTKKVKICFENSNEHKIYKFKTNKFVNIIKNKYSIIWNTLYIWIVCWIEIFLRRKCDKKQTKTTRHVMKKNKRFENKIRWRFKQNSTQWKKNVIDIDVKSISTFVLQNLSQNLSQILSQILSQRQISLSILIIIVYVIMNVLQ